MTPETIHHIEQLIEDTYASWVTREMNFDDRVFVVDLEERFKNGDRATITAAEVNRLEEIVRLGE